MHIFTLGAAFLSALRETKERELVKVDIFFPLITIPTTQ
jgi:hypothetical protein